VIEAREIPHLERVANSKQTTPTCRRNSIPSTILRTAPEGLLAEQ